VVVHFGKSVARQFSLVDAVSETKQVNKLNASNKVLCVILAVTKQLHILFARRAYRTANLSCESLPNTTTTLDRPWPGQAKKETRKNNRPLTP
jgi:hypothetical protein